MRLSKFAKFIELDKNEYAIYNNLKLDVFVVNKEIKEKIFNNEIEDKKIISDLKKSAIYVDNENDDDLLLDMIRKPFKDNEGIVKILYLFVTDDCNLKCKYCFLENNPLCSKERKKMTEEVAFAALEKFAKHLLKHGETEGTIILYGGEPTLNFDLIKSIVSYAKKFDIKFEYNMISNGTLLTQDMLDFIKDNNIYLGISIDGPKDITDKNRRFRNSDHGVFNNVWKTKRMLDSKGTEYSMSMVISEYFLENKEKVIEWVKNNCSQPVFFNLLHHDYANPEAEKIGKKEAEFIIDSFYKISENNSNVYDMRLQRQINSFVNRQFTYSDCGAIGFKQLTVLPNGDLTICHADVSNKDRHVGNIFDTDIDDILNTNEAKFFMSRYTLLRDECLNCEALFCCGGGCPNHSGVLYGDRNINEKPFCEYIKKVFRWMIAISNNQEKGGEKNEKD